MKAKNVILAAGMLIAQSSFALGQCPGDVKECGPNPFYILAVGFTQVCSEAYPERSLDYKAALARMVSENTEAYAKIDADAEFQGKLREFKREARRLPALELDKECRGLLSGGATSSNGQ
ncbi:hypothetical protein ACN9MY_06600 [Pseudoduganella sp. R-31]|uniref:hypothetical protein n=1 Tax=unclassified Pseudoduganella TaxID=2637179 RepID=UPI003CF579BB